jgi:phosphohistidine phosphatase
MRRLILLRHAKSDWSAPGMPDRERPLNERGEAAARIMGAYMARHGLLPDRILCSPARRTRETLEAVTFEWPDTIETTFEDRLYAAGPESILAVIRAVAAPAHGLLVVGHNPGMHEIAEMLIAAGDIAPRERLREKFPTCALAVIDFTAETWDKLAGQCGRLDRFITPRSIAAATN